MTHTAKSFWLIAVLCLAVAIVSFRFLAVGMDDAFPVLKVNINADRIVFSVHVVAASIALVAGVPQFLSRLRTQRPMLHRWTGRAYGLSVMLGGLSGIALAIYGSDRPVAASGFGALGILWLVATIYAVWLVRSGRIAEHRQWMVRSFALTFAAVTLRLELPIFFALGLDYPEASNYVAWLCWIPNLVVAEWLARKRFNGEAPERPLQSDRRRSK